MFVGAGRNGVAAAVGVEVAVGSGVGVAASAGVAVATGRLSGVGTSVGVACSDAVVQATRTAATANTEISSRRPADCGLVVRTTILLNPRPSEIQRTVSHTELGLCFAGEHRSPSGLLSHSAPRYRLSSMCVSARRRA